MEVNAGADAAQFNRGTIPIHGDSTKPESVVQNHQIAPVGAAPVLTDNSELSQVRFEKAVVMNYLEFVQPLHCALLVKLGKRS
jgi:hypothetical protein